MLPPAVDAPLQVCAGERLISEGRHDEALPFARHAVEELSGRDYLIAWEAKVVAGDSSWDSDRTLNSPRLAPDAVPAVGSEAGGSDRRSGAS